MSVFRRAAARRGTAADWLVVGLGNPGEKYAGSRHNVGAEAVERWATALGCELQAQRREHARTAVAPHRTQLIALACPTTFMNESGQSVSPLVKRHGIVEAERVVIVHDELDLEPGRVKVKIGGGIAGHNGLASVASHLGSRDFVRIRLGIGKPPHPDAGKKWVLQQPGRRERELLDAAVDIAVSALERVVRDGAEAAMNTVNSPLRPPRPDPPRPVDLR
ncbi:aminoacyl-tRNA hydrolase [Candidatus Poriferisodalis sp.]|uniref:aminoacyl-tRNA hydrolase n=1 Tax=Candidatus Poriferisodalis sp. TaxID=3101277 RepID=UPI003D0F10BA